MLRCLTLKVVEIIHAVLCCGYTTYLQDRECPEILIRQQRLTLVFVSSVRINADADRLETVGVALSEMFTVKATELLPEKVVK